MTSTGASIYLDLGCQKHTGMFSINMQGNEGSLAIFLRKALYTWWEIVYYITVWLILLDTPKFGQNRSRYIGWNGTPNKFLSVGESAQRISDTQTNLGCPVSILTLSQILGCPVVWTTLYCLDNCVYNMFFTGNLDIFKELYFQAMFQAQYLTCK